MAKDDEVIDYYLNEIKKIPLLTPSEELELAKKAKNGDISAKEKIVKSNLRFVITIAKKYQNHGLDLEDLISEGNIGLLIAIEKFEPSKGYKFISYAVWWIRQSILRAISDKGRMIRIPVNKTLEITKIKNTDISILDLKSTGGAVSKYKIDDVFANTILDSSLKNNKNGKPSKIRNFIILYK